MLVPGATIWAMSGELEPLPAPGAGPAATDPDELVPHIGTDEAGKGDYFGSCTEPFPSCLCPVNLQCVDGLGKLADAPGAAAELGEDLP